MPLGLGCLVSRQARDLGEVRLRQAQRDVTLADRHDLMPGQADQTGHRRKGHFPAHRHDQSLEEQGKAGEPSGPVGFDLPNAAIGQAHTRDANLQVALVLKEVQVPIALGHGVVRRMHTLDAGHGKAATSDEVDGNGQHLLLGVELNPVDVPRGGNAQGGFEQLGGHVALTHVSKGCASYPCTRLHNGRARTIIHSKFKRGLFLSRQPKIMAWAWIPNERHRGSALCPSHRRKPVCRLRREDTMS